MITPEQLAMLERVYTGPENQKCQICGAPLTFSSSGDWGGGSRYNCHYAASAWTDRGRTDALVVALVRAYRELTARELDSRVTYDIEGDFDGEGWVAYGTLGAVTEEQAAEVYQSWLESRDKAGWEVKYRLVRRSTVDEVVRTEELISGE